MQIPLSSGMKILAFKTVKSFMQRPATVKMGSSIISQSAISVSYFLLGISLAKYASKYEYGMYVVFFSVIEVIGNLQAALITVPLTVLAQNKEATERTLFISGLGVGQFIVAFPVMLVGILGSFLYSLHKGDFQPLQYVAVTCLAIAGNILWEFVRTVKYSSMRIQSLIIIDMFFVLFIGASVVFLIAENRLTSIAALKLLAAGYVFSAVIGVLSARERYCFQWKAMITAFSETWRYSRWALVGTGSEIFKNQSYIYIVTASLGLAPLADISLARMFLRPMGLFFTSSGRISLAKGAEILHRKGFSSLNKFAGSFILFLVFIWLSYVCVLWFSYEYLITYLGNKYGNIGLLIMLWAAYFFVYMTRYTLSNALLVCKDFKSLAKFGMSSAAFTIIACLFLAKLLGSYGALVSLIAGEVILLQFVAMRFRELGKSGPKQFNSSLQPPLA